MHQFEDFDPNTNLSCDLGCDPTYVILSISQASQKKVTADMARMCKEQSARFEQDVKKVKDISCNGTDNLNLNLGLDPT